MSGDSQARKERGAGRVSAPFQEGYVWREGGVQPGDLLPVGSPPPHRTPPRDRTPTHTPAHHAPPPRQIRAGPKGRNGPPHSLLQKRPIGSAGDSKAPPRAQECAPRSRPWQTSWTSGGHGGEGGQGGRGRRSSQSIRGELQAASSDPFPLIPWLGCRCKHRAETRRARPQCKPGPFLLIAELRLRASWGES